MLKKGPCFFKEGAWFYFFFKQTRVDEGRGRGETNNTLQSEENKFLDATLFSVESLYLGN